MNFNEKLISLHKSKGLSQEELGAQLKVSRQTISKWESAQSYPDFQRLVLLSDYFGLTLDELVKDVDVQEVREKNASSEKIDAIYQGRPHSKTLCQVVFGGRGNCRRRCPGAAPLFCSQRRLCLVKCGRNKAGSDRFPAFFLP